MDADAVQELLGALQKPQIVDLELIDGDATEHAVALLPEGYKLESLKALLPPPRRIRQAVTATTVESFTRYVNAYHTGRCAVFADEDKARFEAVLDYHKPSGERGEQEHVVTYGAPFSLEWQAWVGNHGKFLPQVEFATFLESRLPEIVAPAPASLLELALDLQVHKAVVFRSDHVLQNGQTRFRYEEEISGSSSRNGELVIPKSFTIRVPVFQGEPPVDVEALFKYRLADQKLTLGYQLLRHEYVVIGAARKVAESLRAGLDPAVQYYRGKRS